MATYVHGKGANFQIGNAAAALIDISPVVTDATISISIDSADTSHFGSNSKTYITGQNDAVSNVTGLFDRATVAMLTALFNAFVSGTVVSTQVVMGPEGTVTGSTKLTQAMIMTSLKIDAPVSGLVAASFDLQRTGDTTFGTF